MVENASPQPRLVPSDAPVRRTAGPDQRAVAHLVDAVGAIDDRRVRRHAERFVAELIAVSPAFRQAVELFEQQAEALCDIDRAMPRPAMPDPATPHHGTPDQGDAEAPGEWALALCRLGDQLDDLVAMAEPSGFADPAELLDPSGTMEPLLGHIARIAAVMAGRGDPRMTPELLTWLERGAEREERERGFLRRADERPARWPWNATGAMGRVGATAYLMTYGALLPLERRFRASMVRARSLASSERAGRTASRRVLARLRDGAALPPRMAGLLVAAEVTLALRQLVRGDEGTRSRAAIDHGLDDLLDSAGCLLRVDGSLAREDAEGLTFLTQAIDAWRNEHADVA